jgi:hypothetical protein
MNQYKAIFLGTVDPNSDFAHLKRAVNSQKVRPVKELGMTKPRELTDDSAYAQGVNITYELCRNLK